MYEWIEHKRRFINYEKHYKDYLYRYRTLSGIAGRIGTSVPTLQKRFADIAQDISWPKPSLGEPINLLLDATYFGRQYGYLCFHDTERVIHARQIQSESVEVIEQCINELLDVGYTFKSVTLDGRRGTLQLFEKRFPRLPIQMCQFHMKMIVLRLIGQRPISPMSLDIQHLMTTMHDEELFYDTYKAVYQHHKTFFDQRDQKGQRIYKKQMTALRSIYRWIPYLFTHQQYPKLNIPHTTNHLESTFAHLKQKLKRHHGLQFKSKQNAINFILNNP